MDTQRHGHGDKTWKLRHGNGDMDVGHGIKIMVNFEVLRKNKQETETEAHAIFVDPFTVSSSCKR